MKKLILNFLIVTAAVSFYSCEEDFNLKTDYKPRYSLNCVIRADTNVHIATLTKSYMVDGFDPYENKEDPFLSGADIRLWQKDNVVFFTDTLIKREDTSRYTQLQKCYFIRNFQPLENDVLEIKAILDNGKVLEAHTTVPRKVKWDSSSTFIIPLANNDDFPILWSKNNNINWFLLRLQIRYKTDGVNSPVESALVPILYNGDKPVYPFATKNAGISFRWSAFDRTMRELSNGHPDKSNIVVYGVLVELLVLDENLSKYYSNLNGYMDDFTIRVDQNDFSNIKGGLGIFGSYIKQSGGIHINRDYIQSMGYKTPN
jgi:hypothetical protein